MPGPRVSVTSSRAVVAAAGRRGVDTAALLARHGLAQAVLDDPDARLEATLVHALWRDAMAAAREPALPLHAALELPWGAYRVIDYLCGHSDTLGEAATMLARNFGLVNDAVVLRLRPLGDGAAMRLERADGGPVPAPYVDYALAACAGRLLRVTGATRHPAVRRKRAAPADLGPHVLAFGDDVLFDQDVDELRFDGGLWRAPCSDPQPGLRSVLHRHADLLLAQIGPRPTLLGQLREEVERGLPFGRTELARVAARLDSSPRTIQRRLAAEGLTWRAVLAAIRGELARSYLRDPALSIDEVACMVGYSDATAFHRAFLRTNGQTPGDWRHTH